MTLRLDKLPDRTPVRMTVSVDPDLASALADYATIYCQAYGEEEKPETLIPAMLEKIGSNQTYHEESGTKYVVVSGFWMDPTEVTVSDFEKLVTATGYVTVAERGLAESEVDPEMLKAHPEYTELMVPGGAVFKPDSRSSPRNLNWWAFVPGAS